ncbi:MAG: PAS domain S-box protein [Xanthobacteraceae bacterium]
MRETFDWADSRRLTELKHYEILDTKPDSRFDRITNMAAEILDAPIAFISFFDAKRQWFKSKVGIEFAQTGPEASFFSESFNGEFLEIPDTRGSEQYANNPWVTGDPYVRFFAGTPISTSRGSTLGALCVSDRKPRQLDGRHRKDLTELSFIAANLLDLHKAEVDARRTNAPTLLTNDQLQPILNLVPYFVVILDQRGRVMDANKSALEMAGLVASDVVGKLIWECHWWSYAPDGQIGIQEAVARAAAGDTTRYEVLIQTKNGSLATIDCTVAPSYDSNDKIAFIVVSGLDISSRLLVEGHLRESEKRFRGTFENAAVGMAHVSLDGRWLRFNDVLLDTLGYSREEFLQKTLSELAHADDLPGHIVQFGRLKAGVIDSYTREKRYIKKDGRFVWVNVTASLQRSDSGEPLYAILVIEDITFRKNAELRQRMLVGELSHRVKNIMSMVQSIANQGIGLSSEPERFLAAFRARLQAMARAHDLLTHESWQRAELSELIRSQVTLNGVIEDGRVLVDGPSVMLPGQLALNLALVLHELASNALRYGALSTPTGTIDIKWTIANGSEPKSIDLTWRELNGPAVKPPTEFGFGAKLVDRLLKRGLGAEVDVTWDPAGLIIRFQLPIPEVRREDYFIP